MMSSGQNNRDSINLSDMGPIPTKHQRQSENSSDHVPENKSQITITSDEVNYLVYRYVDSFRDLILM
jgi:hypothetical protein